MSVPDKPNSIQIYCVQQKEFYRRRQKYVELFPIDTDRKLSNQVQTAGYMDFRWIVTSESVLQIFI